MGSHQSRDNFDYNKLGNGTVNIKLTESDIALIKTSWNSVKDHEELGLAIMIRIFKVHSNIKHVWIFSTRLETEEEIRNDSQVRYHSKKLVNTFDKIIKDLETDFIKHKEFLVNLGTKHYHYDLKYEYFKVINCIFIYMLKNL